MRFSVKLCSIVCLAVAAFAQSDRGTIIGTVADPTGALIPGAALSLKNSDTGAAYVSRTTETGNYTLPSLTAGGYELTVDSTNALAPPVRNGSGVPTSGFGRVNPG